MEFSIQIYVNGVCKSVINVPVDSNPVEVGFKLLPKDTTKPPEDKDIYTKASEISPFKLYVDDIQHKYPISWFTAKKKVADKLWPESPQKPRYHSIAASMKDEFRRKKWLLKEPVNALSVETCAAVEQLLWEL